MKRTYLARRNALLSSTNFSWGAFALIFSIFLLLMRLLAPNFFWTVFTPVFRASDSLSEMSSSFFNSFSDTAKLSLQNEKLMNENIELANENIALIKKIENLSGLVQYDSGIMVGVVARPPQSAYDTLVLSAGSTDGIALGMEVFSAGDVPLGIISSVDENFSRVTLFSAPEMSTDGWVGKDDIPITINGAGAGVMNASASRSAGISVGDIVYAPGPGQLPIGRVVRVDSEASSPSVTLRIMPAINLFSVAWVIVRDTGISLP
ncbi:MAG: rod shape-determining protein MreC [bacterium]|nr:rod shape-determining protein MreC [bacterium]